MLENTPENRQPYEVMLTEGERGYLRVASWPWLPDMDEFNENLPRFQEAFNTEDTPPEHLEALRALMAGDKDTWRIKNHMNKFMNRFMNLDTDYSGYDEDEDENLGDDGPQYLDDVLADALDVEYRLDANFKMTSVLVTLELGGPNMFLDTERCEMICTWGAGREVRELPMGIIAEVDNYFGEYAAGVGQISYKSWHPMDTRTQRGTPQPHQPALTPVGPSVEM